MQRAGQRGVTTLEYVVLTAVLVLGAVAAWTLFRRDVDQSASQIGEGIGRIGSGQAGEVGEKYADRAAALGTSSGALSPAAAEPESQVGDGGGGDKGPLGHVGDFFGGLYLGGKDAVVGIGGMLHGGWNLTAGWVTNPTAARDTWDGLSNTATAVWNDPSLLWDAVKEPYVTAWNEGRPGEAIGRGVFEIVVAVVGTKGLDKASKASKLGGASTKLDDLARTGNKLDDLARTGRKGPQSSSKLDDLYRQAGPAQKELGQATRDIAEATGGRPVVPDELKGIKRAQEKVDADYGGDASLLTDLARTSIEYGDLDDVYRGLDALKDRFEIIKVKDRFKDPTPEGYRDILVNVRTSNGHVSEVQLHLKPVLDVKNGPGHKLYEEIRTIRDRAKIEGRAPTAQELERIEALTEASRKLYEQALAVK